ncbi:MAG: hypothetical protein WCN86_02095, partial [bacterium]
MRFVKMMSLIALLTSVALVSVAGGSTMGAGGDISAGVLLIASSGGGGVGAGGGGGVGAGGGG